MHYFLIIWTLIFSVHQTQCCNAGDGYFGWVCDTTTGCFCKQGQTCQKTLSPNCPSHCVDNPWGIGCVDEKLNLALEKPTKQSSNHTDGYPSLAVDGNNSTDVSMCARTNQDTNPWWQVDLGGLYVIRTVAAIMPNNCQTDAGITLYIGNDTTQQGNTQLSNMCSFELLVNPPALGRYVKFSKSGSQSLQLCEVNVRGYTYPYNIAFGKTASQSSFIRHKGVNWIAKYAIDGNTDTDFDGGSCSHTNVEHNPWWKVDLGGTFSIYSVTLVNRAGESGKNLKNIEINAVSPNNTSYHCASRVEHLPPGGTVELPCNTAPIVGQFVRISLNNNPANELTLCEVMVKGYKYQECANSKTFGPECGYECNCKNTAEVCDRRTGACGSGCANGWRNQENVCQTECPSGTFGQTCGYTCHCRDDFACSITNGFACPRGCQRYWKDNGCHQERPHLEKAPTVTSKTVHSVNIRWDRWSSESGQGVGSVRSYIARAWKDSHAVDNTKTLSANAKSATIENLFEYTEYNFTVSVEDEEGQEGKPSPSITSRTCGTPVIIPQPVLRASLKAHWNASQITIRTQGMTEAVHRCDGFRKLKLSVRGEFGDNINVEVMDVKQSQDILIENLIPHSNYTVNLSAVNNLNLEGPVFTLYGLTPEGVPPKMEPPTVVSRGDDAVELYWEAPRPPRGIITEYDIGYAIRGENWKEAIVNPGIREKSIENLRHNKTYRFWIRAKTIIGYGDYSDIIETITVAGKPGPPTNFTTTRRSVTSLELSWREPFIRNGIITGFKIECYADGNIDLHVQQNLTMATRSHVFTNLAAGTRYTCSLKARTSAGYGDTSQLVTWTHPKASNVPATEIPEETPPNRKSTVGVVVGGVVAAILVVAGVAIAVLVYMRRRRLGCEAHRSSGAPSREMTTLNLKKDREDYEFPNNPMPENPYMELSWEHSDDSVEQDTDISIDDIFKVMKTKNWETLKAEFEKLPTVFTAKCVVGQKPENHTKNRFETIMPYDHSRVALSLLPDDPHSDYINANYIDGYGQRGVYIASQGPKPSTVKDFWRMVWQEDSPLIVMLTNLTEDAKAKCANYWPEKDSKQFGFIAVTLKKVETHPDFTVRTLRVSMSNSSTRTVQQFHFTGWPDHGVPLDASALVRFREKVKGYQRTVQCRGPIIVHSSAGVGRTGTFIALDYLLDQAKAEGKINIFNLVQHMRRSRPMMIQTEEQYFFIHDTILEELYCGITTVPVQKLQSYFHRLMQLDSKSGLSKLEKEFAVLQHMFDGYDDASKSALDPANVNKNRVRNITSANGCRSLNCGADIINAVFIDGYRRADAFIVTQTPLPDTLVDFWRMIYDHNSATIVMVNEATDLAKTDKMYVPISYGPFTVEVISTHDIGNSCAVKDLTLKSRNGTNKEPRKIRQFQLQGWKTSDPTPSSTEALLELLDGVQSWQQQSGNTVITIHCMNGAHQSGIFCAVSRILEKMKVEQQVDVFHTVKAVRINRPQFIDSLEQYRFCYAAVEEYARRFDNYANFHM
ncbi:receptor-type tyrosine-protein phosphatase kappa [Lingula anatina]|uniref:protein-tyrosine-phosphatase n=1 Tax=Lingula anatina TaxID=7574 RepID=A0A1S3JZE2_LINAN|nr:receptor-type tyrosine-protein phosphatase kappa [Lingula anatina]|eukprot:XP_013415647.1 receptor-type tyrosine-protein phosphatase kappa [Lingula anatina]